jgi:hypothetical protein
MATAPKSGREGGILSALVPRTAQSSRREPGRLCSDEKYLSVVFRAAELHHGSEQYSKTTRKIVAADDLNRQKQSMLLPDGFCIDRNKPIDASSAPLRPI